MPTPPVYTNAFEVIGSLAETALGEPSWGYYRSAVIGVNFAVNRMSATSSYDYTIAAYATITATTDTLFRSWFPFQLQLVFNQSFSPNPSHFVVRDWVLGDPDDDDRPFVAEEDFQYGVVGATVTAYDLSTSSPANFFIALEAGNHNGIAQDTVSFQGPITAIVLP
jgi:hypothetical protein